ncbi:hypothetical protein ACFQZE_11725 [Paenibacillus sp. GCM10027627]
MYWKNVHIPTKSSTIHTATCRHMGDHNNRSATVAGRNLIR